MSLIPPFEERFCEFHVPLLTPEIVPRDGLIFSRVGLDVDIVGLVSLDVSIHLRRPNKNNILVFLFPWRTQIKRVPYTYQGGDI